MDFSFNDLQRMLHESAETYARDHGDFERRRRLMASAAGYAQEDWKLMADLGWLALLLPEELGGVGGGPVETMIIMEALGKALAGEPYLSTAVLGAGCLLRHGTPAQRDACLGPLALGDYRMALAHREQDSHENRHAVALRARRDGAGYVLDGAKQTVFDAPGAQAFMVSARTDGASCARDGITMFLVPATAAGLTQRPFRRLDGGRASHLAFEGVRVDDGAVLGRRDDGAAVLDDLYAHAIGALCGEALGAMQAMHDAALDYLKVRRQFGRPIGTFQALQHRQVDMYTALEEARSLTLAANMALAESMPEAERLLSMAKAQVGKSARIVGQGAIQLHGGIGMTEELQVGAHFKRTTVIEAMFGSRQHHLARLIQDRQA
ncbi:acyl-CoA dehydrogenase family protein [Achromobacter pestifer]|uniref:Acyl-CoA dehydrogenase family protein n=1 Tax=Achromobacter pestifer TaxID=1353889 RepID=A0A7D4HY09_9BURK|nr:acyl-CoA dehydrogenase [Achromobacter pestifer]QKH39533.1 acyl-CoA dehydrogenase family protein [Achromobacter pestifer]